MIDSLLFVRLFTYLMQAIILLLNMKVKLIYKKIYKASRNRHRAAENVPQLREPI